MDTLEQTETAAPEIPAPKPTVFEALAAAMADVQAVGKTGRNNHDGYNFRGIDAVVNAAGPAFRKHGIIPIPILKSITYKDTQTSTGKAIREVNVEVIYQFVGPAGDRIDLTVPGEAMDRGDKGTAKAMSVAYRIALLQLLCIPTDEPDPDESSYERGQTVQSVRPEPEPQPGGEAQELMASVNAMKHQGAAPRVWSRIVEAVKKGVITEDEGTWLRARFEERGPELPPDPDKAAEGETTEPALEGELITTGANE